MTEYSCDPILSFEQPLSSIDVTESLPKCARCPKTGPKSCGSCHCIFYCSSGCKKDAKSHRRVCKAFSELREICKLPQISAHPATQARLAILFPEDLDLPELIWVMNDQQYCTKDTFSPLFGLRHQYPGLYGAGEDTEPSSKDLGHAVLVDCCEFIQDRDFQKNKCVDRVIADGARHDLNAAARNDWYGPIIIRSAKCYDNASWNTITKKRRQQVAGVQRMTDEDSYYRDIEIEDFHFAINHLMAFGDGWATVPEYEFTKSTWKDTELDPVLLEVANERFSNNRLECTAAAKICCLGEQEFLGRDKYIKVQIAFNHPIYQLNPLDISWMLGLPLLVRPALLKLEKGEEDWRNEQFLESKQHLNINPYQNYSGRYLNLEMDAESPGWGLPNVQDSFDTVLVARQDQKPLLLEHLEALTMFCCDLAEKMKEFRLQENEHPEQAVIVARERFMREWVCKEGFEKFLEAFKAAKVGAGLTEWENVTSPFNQHLI